MESWPGALSPAPTSEADGRLVQGGFSRPVAMTLQRPAGQHCSPSQAFQEQLPCVPSQAAVEIIFVVMVMTQREQGQEEGLPCA